MCSKITFKQYHPWGMMTNIFHIIVICCTPLNQDFSKVTMIIMFVDINEITRKVKSAAP